MKIFQPARRHINRNAKVKNDFGYLKDFFSLALVLVILNSCNKDHNSDLPNADEYCTWKIDGKAYSVTSPAVQVSYLIQDSITYLWFRLNQPYTVIEINIPGPRQPGTYSLDDYNLYSYVEGAKYTTANNGSGTTATVTKWGAIGDYIEGTFAGKIADIDNQSLLNHTISGNFRVKVRN